MNRDELKYKNLIKQAEKKGLGWGIKFTRANGDSWTKKYPTVNYRVGEIVEVGNAPKRMMTLGPGLYLGNDFIGAGGLHRPEKIFFCTYDKADLCDEFEDMVRVRKLKVESELPVWMGYGKDRSCEFTYLDKNNFGITEKSRRYCYEAREVYE
jgi:hypothetical protein